MLWAGVEPSPALLAFHRSLGTALTDAVGFRPEGRPYSPHISLVRLNGPVPQGVVERYLEHHSRLQVPPFIADRFALLSSVVADEGPQYREVAVFDLVHST